NRRITTTSLEIQLKLKNRHGVQRMLTINLNKPAIKANAAKPKHHNKINHVTGVSCLMYLFI
ncbi:hypothetical protein, partial [Acinetobacter guillouiae]|uniref:hypothetical protein n=1 Tax=Acinetobacter guillouiae TaxID=106649 RepID=UPI003AFFD8F1